jgi:hypothetical protein
VKYVPQRTHDDCMIAAFATATDSTYEDLAEAFGVPCNGDGYPSLPAVGGINLLTVPVPLLSLGFNAVLCLSAEGADSPTMRLPTSDALKALLPARTAVLSIPDARLGTLGIQHALAWKNGAVIDCREAEGKAPSLEQLTLSAVVLLTPANGEGLN